MKLSLFSLIWLLATSTLLADSSVLPKPSKYVTDKAGVLKDGGSALNEQLKKLQDDTTAQLLVYIDKKLPANTTIEDVAVKSFRSWGVGQKDKNNGIALFIFVDDRKMRLEVGYGLEGRIPDLVAKRVLDTLLKPPFKEKVPRYEAGITAAVNELSRLTRAESGIKTEPAAGSKESQRGPFGGSASSLSSSSSSASTAPSSASSLSNSSATSSAASSALLGRSPEVGAAAVVEEPPSTGIKYLWWLLAGVLLTAAAVWAYLLNDLAKKEARNKQAKLDRQAELARLQREEEARQRRFDSQRDSVLFQPVTGWRAPTPPRSTTPIVKNTSKPLVAAAAVTGVAALTAAEVARRRSSSSSWSSSSDSGSSSSSSFDSGGGSSGGGGASSDW
jgi:uncharacterized protein